MFPGQLGVSVELECLDDLVVASVSDLVAGAVSIDRSLDIEEPERYIKA